MAGIWRGLGESNTYLFVGSQARTPVRQTRVIDGGWCRTRTCATLRSRRRSNALPFLSANHPKLGIVVCVAPTKPGALGRTRTRIGRSRNPLTIQLVHERATASTTSFNIQQMDSRTGASPAHGRFADGRVHVSPPGNLAASRGLEPRTTRFRVERSELRGINGQRGWIRTTDPLLPRQVGTARLP